MPLHYPLAVIFHHCSARHVPSATLVGTPGKALDIAPRKQANCLRVCYSPRDPERRKAKPTAAPKHRRLPSSPHRIIPPGFAANGQDFRVVSNIGVWREKRLTGILRGGIALKGFIITPKFRTRDNHRHAGKGIEVLSLGEGVAPENWCNSCSINGRHAEVHKNHESTTLSNTRDIRFQHVHQGNTFSDTLSLELDTKIGACEAGHW